MTTKNLKIAVLREEFKVLTGHHIQALALNQFVYWENRTKDAKLYREEEKQRFNNENESNKELPQYGWIYKTAEELAKEILLDVHPTTVRRHLKVLEEKGYLFKRTNSRYKWDKTYQYRVNLVKVVKDLERLGYPIKDYEWLTSGEGDKKSLGDQDNSSSKENAGSRMHNDSSKVFDAGAIPENTTKTITEITSNQKDEEASCSLNHEVIEESVNVILKHFKELSGKKYVSNADKECIRNVADQGWPTVQVLQWMAECFEQFTPRHPKDSIRSFKYVENYLFNRAHQVGLLTMKNQEVMNHAKQSEPLERNSKQSTDPLWYQQLRNRLSENEGWEADLECDF
jgi:DNA-binding MarR family transcriptional regulator